MNWPDMIFPPINLWSAPVQQIKYDFESGKLEDEPVIKALRGDDMIAYMDKLKWFADNPMKPVFISERSQ